MVSPSLYVSVSLSRPPNPYPISALPRPPGSRGVHSACPGSSWTQSTLPSWPGLLRVSGPSNRKRTLCLRPWRGQSARTWTRCCDCGRAWPGGCGVRLRGGAGRDPARAGRGRTRERMGGARVGDGRGFQAEARGREKDSVQRGWAGKGRAGGASSENAVRGWGALAASASGGGPHCAE